MKHNISLAGGGARIATSVVIGLSATVLFACANESTPTSPSLAASAASASRLPVLQPDRIVYQSNRANTGTFDIYSMLPDGSDNTRLTTSFDNYYPSLSPDGKHIVFVSNRDNSALDIYV